MNQPLIHHHTKRSIEAIKTAPPHGILLVGPSGIGKFSLAQQLLTDVLQTDGQSYADYPYSIVIATPEGKNVIGVDAIRELEQFLSLKVPRNKEYNRGIIVENADLMSHEAQTALLKTLEEPPSDTVLVLTASHQNSLLPTIVSRVQAVTVQRPDKSSVVEHFKNVAGKDDIEQIYAISGGLPGLMNNLLQDEDHPLKAATEKARQLLGQKAHHRLLEVDGLSKDKQLAGDTVYIMQQMAHISLKTATGASAQKWREVMKASHKASEDLKTNAQPKLVLTNLMLQL